MKLVPLTHTVSIRGIIWMLAAWALLLLALSVLPGCSTLSNLNTSPVAVATHTDLKAAAAYATAHGYPARAAVWTSIDAQLAACNNAISAAVPAAPTAAPPGVFTAVEIGAEAVGNVSGVPAAVKLNCAPLPLVVFPTLKLP